MRILERIEIDVVNIVRRQVQPFQVVHGAERVASRLAQAVVTHVQVCQGVDDGVEVFFGYVRDVVVREV